MTCIKYKHCRWIISGILSSVLSVLGLIGNTISLIILSNRWEDDKSYSLSRLVIVWRKSNLELLSSHVTALQPTSSTNCQHTPHQTIRIPHRISKYVLSATLFHNFEPYNDQQVDNKIVTQDDVNASPPCTMCSVAMLPKPHTQKYSRVRLVNSISVQIVKTKTESIPKFYINMNVGWF